jgi:hypothetical protein
MELPSKTSEPPPASSWATPPEFYCDENITTRSVRRFLMDLGYVVHTPAELLGSRKVALGTSDEVWLAKVAKTGWAVLNRDTKIIRRRDELAAYRRAGVHMFYLPGEAKVAVLVELVSVNLAAICTATASRQAKLWYLTPAGLSELTLPK